MTSETFGVIAVIGFGFAVVFAIAAAVYGVKCHVRSVHDELTGRSAQRAIDAMREGRGSVPALAVQQGVRGDVQSGSLRLREVNSHDRKPFAASSTLSVASDASPCGEGALESEAGTTLLDSVASSGAAFDSEAGTTLLSQGEQGASPAIPSEAETSLLAQGASHGAPGVESESETTLLGSETSHAVLSESETTLLSGKEV